MSSPDPTSHPKTPEAEPQPSAPAWRSPPAWRAFVHLYLPILTSIVLILFVPNPFAHRALLLASALPTYFLASLVYQPRLRPAVRFTRRSHLHRAAVLFTYGRLLGTPFRLENYIIDVVASYGIGYFLDRPEGKPPRWSEFLVHALWTGASTVLFGLFPPLSLPWVIMGAIDRTMYRAAYLALVDDLVRFLGYPYPTIASKRGRAIVLGPQAAFIAVSILWVYFRIVMSGAWSCFIPLDGRIAPAFDPRGV